MLMFRNKKLAKDWLSIISKFESLLILNYWTFFSHWNLFLIFKVAVRSKHEECSSERFWRKNHASHASLSSTKCKPRLYYYCILLVRANRSLNSCLTFVPGDTFCRISSEHVWTSCNWRVSDVASCLMIATRPTTTNPTNSCLKISATNYETARLLSTRLCSFSARVRKSEMKGLFCCKKWRVGKVKFGGTVCLCHDVCKGLTFKYFFRGIFGQMIFQKRREGLVIIFTWTNFKYHYIIELGVLHDPRYQNR